MENHRINWKSRYKMAINKHLLIITLNINGLNAPIKRGAEWIKKQKPSICCLQETHLRTKDTYRLKVKGGEYFMPIDMTGKQELQYSYQKKWTLK